MNDWSFDISVSLFLIIEPFVPYEVDVAAATEVGKGTLIKKLFFTIQSGE